MGRVGGKREAGCVRISDRDLRCKKKSWEHCLLIEWRRGSDSYLPLKKISPDEKEQNIVFFELADCKEVVSSL